MALTRCDDSFVSEWLTNIHYVSSFTPSFDAIFYSVHSRSSAFHFHCWTKYFCLHITYIVINLHLIYVVYSQVNCFHSPLYFILFFFHLKFTFQWVLWICRFDAMLPLMMLLMSVVTLLLLLFNCFCLYALLIVDMSRTRMFCKRNVHYVHHSSI